MLGGVEPVLFDREEILAFGAAVELRLLLSGHGLIALLANCLESVWA